MKRLATIIVILFFGLVCFGQVAFTALKGIEAHEKYVYPVVRVSGGGGTGSGTVIYSRDTTKEGEESRGYSTYILTNYHVVANAIKITEEWDSKLQKNRDIERRSTCYVEIFKYKDLSTPVGTLRIEADIVIYNKLEDMALLKLRSEEEVKYVATLPNKNNTRFYRIMDESVASGCSLGHPTLVSVGVITRLSYQVRSLSYDMSSAQIIFGNSGGAMFSGNGVFMGIPSMVAIVGWSDAITHIGLFIPVHRIYDWLQEEYYDFIYDSDKEENVCLSLRKENIKAMKKQDRE